MQYFLELTSRFFSRSRLAYAVVHILYGVFSFFSFSQLLFSKKNCTMLFSGTYLIDKVNWYSAVLKDNQIGERKYFFSRLVFLFTVAVLCSDF